MKPFFYVLFLIPFILFSQKKQNCYQVDYQQIKEGNLENKINSIFSCGTKVYLSKPKNKIQTFSDLENKEYITIIKYNDSIFKHSIPFDKLPEPTFEKKTEKILGHNCSYAKYSYFSNLIEVWFTEKTKAKGSLYGKFLPTEKALVLKIRINNGEPIVATKIKKIKENLKLQFLPKKAREISKSELEEIKIKSRYTTIPVFKNEQVYFNPSLKLPNKSSLQSNKTYHLSKGTVILKRIKIPDSLKYSENIFATLKIQSNGDAYDRTGTVFLLPKQTKHSMLNALLDGTVKNLPKFKDKRGLEYQGVKRIKQYEPLTEIMRFFTPFGVGYFNKIRPINNYKWDDYVTYKEEITNLIPSNENEFWIGLFIGNYDKGGHKVTLDLTFYPKSEATSKDIEKFVYPLFSTVNIMEMSNQGYSRLFKTDTLNVDFNLDKNIKNLQLVYTTTGHGGWDTGDEFVPRQNKILIDGKEVFKVIPWRTDCASYRLSNPASGNFKNGMSSSDYSRSNWCPGTITYPYFIRLKDLKPGKHTIQIIIEQGDDTKNSFSHWNVSGVLIGNIKN